MIVHFPLDLFYTYIIPSNIYQLKLPLYHPAAQGVMIPAPQ